MQIKKITTTEVWPIRHIVMWPDKDLDYIKVKGDESAFHYGLYDNDELVSVVSLFLDGDNAQFRKFATLQNKQGNGYGTKLLNYVIAEAEKLGAKTIWCNARAEKTEFYRKFGLLETERTFEKGGKNYIIMEKKY